MKKSLRILLLLFLVLTTGVVLFFAIFTKPVDLGFAEKITLNYVHEHNDKDIHVEITDREDFARLVSISKGRANAFDWPSCGFGTAELIFEGNGKSIAIYPACDSCGAMRLGKPDKYFYGISDKNRRLLEEILAKYGAAFPCV